MWLIENSGLLSQETQTAEARAVSRHGKFLDGKCPNAGWTSEMPCGGKGGKQLANKQQEFVILNLCIIRKNVIKSISRGFLIAAPKRD